MVDEQLLEPLRPVNVADDAILRVIRVPPEAEGMRLDRFLSSQLRATSRTRARAIIQSSAYSIEGRHLRPSDRVRGDTRIALWRPPLDETPPPTDVVVLAEDEQLLVVDKPAHMTVHPTARHHRHTLIKHLEAQRPEEYLSLVHRLDRETSGVLLVARSREADRRFKMGLEERSIAAARAAERGLPIEQADKSYIAITWGIPTAQLIEEPLEPDPSPLRVKMRVARKGSGMAARTGVQVLSTIGEKYALVRCDLFTGRQHQIRVHLAHIGTPLVGDKLYGPDDGLLARGADDCLTEEDLAVLELPRHALHARTHRLVHCFTGERVEYTAPLPEDLRSFWREKGGELPPGI